MKLMWMQNNQRFCIHRILIKIVLLKEDLTYEIGGHKSI